eukprot:scaffold7375_cov268-Pinguiococcus_pyrenoidosus.AAC.10
MVPGARPAEHQILDVFKPISLPVAHVQLLPLREPARLAIQGKQAIHHLVLLFKSDNVETMLHFRRVRLMDAGRGVRGHKSLRPGLAVQHASYPLRELLQLVDHIRAVVHKEWRLSGAHYGHPELARLHHVDSVAKETEELLDGRLGAF